MNNLSPNEITLAAHLTALIQRIDKLAPALRALHWEARSVTGIRQHG